jgi:hypothetical protein
MTEQEALDVLAHVQDFYDLMYEEEGAELREALSVLNIGKGAVKSEAAGKVEEGAANGWQPIETAPRDGTHILIRPCDGTYNVARWIGFWASVPGAWTRQPTHWQPLPPPPTEKRDDEGVAVKGVPGPDQKEEDPDDEPEPEWKCRCGQEGNVAMACFNCAKDAPAEAGTEDVDFEHRICPSGNLSANDRDVLMGDDHIGAPH